MSRPLVQATDPERLAQALSRGYGVREVGFGQSDAPFFAAINRVQLDGVGLHYCRYDMPIRIQFSHMGGFRQFFCLSGAGQIDVAGRSLPIDESRTGMVPPDSDFVASYGGSYAQIVAQFDAQALMRKAELITGEDLPGSFSLPTLEPLPAQALWRLKLIVMSLAYQFAAEADENDLAIVELAQALSSSFLQENLRAFPHLLKAQPNTAGRNDARRLEDYIHAHWDQPLTVEDVAAACGVSVRSVFARFKQRRGLSPMAYVREVRLEQAKQLLLQGDGEVSVIGVAMRCGFASFGHFAKRYKDRFGELPSATVARGRSRRLGQS